LTWNELLWAHVRTLKTQQIRLVFLRRIKSRKKKEGEDILKKGKEERGKATLSSERHQLETRILSFRPEETEKMGGGLIEAQEVKGADGD